MSDALRLRVFALLGVSFAACAWFAACLDFTPITVAPTGPDGGDAALSDALYAGEREATRKCFECVQEPDDAGGCANEVTACVNVGRCMGLFLCGADRSCYAPGANLVDCLTACGIQEGITSAEDPAVVPFIALEGCATSQCAATCGK